MINKSVFSDFSTLEIQAVLWIEKKKEACSKRIVPKENTVFNCDIRIVLKKYDSTLESKILFEMTFFGDYDWTWLDIKDTTLETRISKKPSINY